MKLTYIWHDCFWLQSDSANVVFDFWKDPTPFTISVMMPQRMSNIPKAVRTIKPHIASPMYCATCLKFAVAVIAVFTC